MKDSSIFVGLLLALAGLGCTSETGGSGGTGGAAGSAGGAGGAAGSAGGAAGGTGGAAGGASEGGGAGGGVVADCSVANTVALRIKSSGASVVHTGEGVTRLNGKGNSTAVGVTWLKDGTRFFLRRDGDLSDGAFDVVQSYNASQYPFHLLLLSIPEGWSEKQCAASPDSCPMIYGLSGTWEVTSLQPLQVKLAIGTLTKDENCWVEGSPLDTSKCTIVEGEVSGCFNVD